jgi:hypothetical protein
MQIAEKIDFSLFCEQVAIDLWGPPNQRLSNDKELRWGARGSRSLDRRRGIWHDHETGEGGSTLQLLMLVENLSYSAAVSRVRRDYAGTATRPQANGRGYTKANGQDRTTARTQPLREVVETYGYNDELGNLSFEVVRYEPKDFRQRRPDGKGGWIWNLDGVRRIIYRLPQVIEEIANGRPVFIVEGERDVGSLAAIGIVATTNPGGASKVQPGGTYRSKWLPEYSQFFQGADVILVPDNDETGRAHMQAAAAALTGAAKSIRYLDLAQHWPQMPDKGDVSDWLADGGGTAEALWLLVEAAPDWTPPAKSDTDEVKIEKPNNWPVLHRAALHGLAGDIVNTIQPQTESDPVAILVHALVFFGNLINRGPYYQVESTRHYTNLYAALVGDTAGGRKGTAEGRARAVAAVVDQEWADVRMKGGLSSGEGFINEVRDELKKYCAKTKAFKVVEPAITDKRLMVIEPELAGALAVMERHGNTLSPLMRKAWDGGILATMTKGSPIKATDAHISVIGHITPTELRARLTRTDVANGFANRFLFVCVKRSKLLPFGGDPIDDKIAMLGGRLKAAVTSAKHVGRMYIAERARPLWTKVYKRLANCGDGLLGAITARAAAQTMRLSMLYALLDHEREDKHIIDEVHLKAAVALWDYCEASAAYIFGDSLGDPVADEILCALLATGAAGMTRTAVSDLFGRHQPAGRIGAALTLLLGKGLVRMEVTPSAGRPVETWFAIKRR